MGSSQCWEEGKGGRVRKLRQLGDLIYDLIAPIVIALVLVVADVVLRKIIAWGIETEDLAGMGVAISDILLLGSALIIAVCSALRVVLWVVVETWRAIRRL